MSKHKLISRKLKIDISQNILLFLLLFSSTIISLVSFYHPTMGKLGFYLWIFSYVPVLILAFKNLIYFIQKKHFFSLGLLIILIVLVINNLTGDQNLSHESTQEIGCALNLFDKAADYGYLKTCLFGYPARQYFLPMLSTLIWGKTQIALNLGNSIYFMLGIIIFSGGVLKFIQNKNIDLINAIALAIIPHLYYVNHFLFHLYEQSIYPFSLTLISLGVYLQYLKEEKNSLLILFALCLQFLIFAYTPSLAVFLLGLVSLFYPLFKHFKKKILL